MHKLEVTKKIGNSEIKISVEGEKPKEILMRLSEWSFPGVSACGKCKSEYLDLQHRKTKDDHHYVFVKCLKCGAELTFGEKKDGKTIYLRTDDNGKPDWQKLER